MPTGERYGYIWELGRRNEPPQTEHHRRDDDVSAPTQSLPVRQPLKLQHPTKVVLILAGVLSLISLVVLLIASAIKAVSEVGDSLWIAVVLIVIIKMSAYKAGKRVTAYKAARSIRKSTWESMKKY
jgi:hypothetical protein